MDILSVGCIHKYNTERGYLLVKGHVDIHRGYTLFTSQTTVLPYHVDLDTDVAMSDHSVIPGLPHPQHHLLPCLLS